MTEEALIWKQFKDGSEAALAILIRRHSKPLAQYGRKLVKDDDLIQDCIQDTYIQLWQYRKNLRQLDEIRPYLFTCLRRKIIHSFRSQSHYALGLEEDTPFLTEFSIEDRLIENETEAQQVAQLNHYLNLLPKRQKEAIYLRFFENMANDEIASIMGIKYQTATNLIHDGLSQLRRSLAPESLSLFWFFCGAPGC